MSEKLTLALAIMGNLDDFSVYMRCQPTRGPLRGRELTRQQLIDCYARAHTLTDLRAEYRAVLADAIR
jgi:hypothetical protein